MIIICEPQCVGFEHAEVNTALLNVISIAFPDDKILFFCESSHLEHIIHNIDKLGLNLVNVKFLQINVPPRMLSNIRRLRIELDIVNKIGSMAKNNETNVIIFLSVTTPGLIAIKVLLHKNKELKCIVIPHMILETILNRPSLIPWETPFWLKPIISRYNERINYLVLGPSIKKELNLVLPELKDIIAIDLPYFFDQNELPQYMNDKKGLSFGSFGVGSRSKGTDLFFRLAAEISAERASNKPKFTIIGPIVDKTLRYEIPKVVNIPSPDTLLNREDFDRLAKNIDYAIFCHNKASHRLTASGAFFDAIAYAKPMIALKNPFFEYYFNMAGDIGYLCNDYLDMKNIVINILESGSADHYNTQVSNILKFRERFEHQAIARTLKDNYIQHGPT
jgi:hypothetical protein